MTLFWCEIHDASAPHKTAHCWYAVAKANDRSGWGAGVCRVVERRLVALDGIDRATVKVALQEGRWSASVVNILGAVLAALDGGQE